MVLRRNLWNFFCRKVKHSWIQICVQLVNWGFNPPTHFEKQDSGLVKLTLTQKLIPNCINIQWGSSDLFCEKYLCLLNPNRAEIIIGISLHSLCLNSNCPVRAAVYRIILPFCPWNTSQRGRRPSAKITGKNLNTVTSFPKSQKLKIWELLFVASFAWDWCRELVGRHFFPDRGTC